MELAQRLTTITGRIPMMQRESIEDIEVKKIGDYIKVERIKSGMSVRKLASITKINAVVIRDTEAGYLSKMSKDDVDKIATALDIPVAKRHQMYDLAANGDIPEDIKEYVMENQFVQTFLRTAMDGYPATKAVCRKFMKNLIKMPNATADTLLQKFAASKSKKRSQSDIFLSELQEGSRKGD